MEDGAENCFMASRTMGVIWDGVVAPTKRPLKDKKLIAKINFKPIIGSPIQEDLA
jgi:hypothetical protein